ncbi:hypothetical protein BHM03_00054375 [Ensete ventricosum]|nr:hypothetical protein BHM03_00054375 [Ensete ventricosum]
MPRRGVGAFIVSAVDHSYLVTLLLLWPTMPSYPSTTLVVHARFGREGKLGRKSRDFVREGELGRKSGDLAEKVNSGANPEIWPRG